MEQADKEPPLKPPNILWISTHDINPDLGCYRGVWPGAEYGVTPNLDRLAAEGARYDNAFASAPVCAPARSAIMTGCFPTAIGTMHMRTKAVPPPEVRLLPEYFREAGYYCTNNDFTDFQVATPPTTFDDCTNNDFTDFQVATPPTTFDDCSSTAHWRNRPNPETPFFAAFHGMATHESRIYYADEAFAEATRNVTPEARHDPDRAPVPPCHPDTPVFRRAWARYNDLITEMDHWVGNLLAQLEEDGLAESTMVVFWSDHGPGMPRAKRWPNEAGLREPLIVRWPGAIRPGTVRTEIVHTMDLAPTMLAASGFAVPAHMHGKALFDHNGVFDDGPNRFVYAGRDRMDEAEDTSRTVRDTRYRYIRHYHPERSAMEHLRYTDPLSTWVEFRDLASREAGLLALGLEPNLLTDLQRSVVADRRPAEELYDLAADPYETVNLANHADHLTALRRLRSALADWQDHYGDLGLLPEKELIEQWRPGGKNRTTETPALSMGTAGMAVHCPTPGASIGWTFDPPSDDLPPAGPLDEVIGAPPKDGRHWNLYKRPIQVEVGTEVWVRAWRLGYEPSPEVSTVYSRVTGPASAAVSSTASTH